MLHPQAEKTLEEYRAAEENGKQHLATFDTLDFEVFSHQEWNRCRRSMVTAFRPPAKHSNS